MAHLKKYAPAKINLGLHILDKREDGYHNIKTIFQEIDLFDTISIKTLPQNTIKIICDAPFVPNNADNLCYRAAALFQKETGKDVGVEIVIDKKIPVGAGLGGGSSDAAAVLQGLNEIFDFPISEKKLETLALDLGSDVPFFLKGGIACGEGRGEILTVVDVKLSRYFPYILLVNPGVHISTVLVYKNFRSALTTAKKNVKLLDLILRLDEIEKFDDLFINEFEPYVFRQYPVLRQIKSELYQYKARYAAMSGSGSTIYACFHNRQNMKIALERFAHR